MALIVFLLSCGFVFLSMLWWAGLCSKIVAFAGCSHLFFVFFFGFFITGPEVITLFSCSIQLSKKFQLLIKTKIRTNEEVSCFKSLRCCIYHANEC